MRYSPGNHNARGWGWREKERSLIELSYNENSLIVYTSLSDPIRMFGLHLGHTLGMFWVLYDDVYSGIWAA